MPKNDQPEHRLSHYCSALIERIMVEPYWATAVDTGTAMMSNSPFARMAWENRRRYMGIRPAHLDWYVYQNPIFMQIELKVGANPVSDGQRTTMRLLNDRGIQADVCRSIEEFYSALLNAGFRLHGNAQNIMLEVAERWRAAGAAAAVPKAAKPFRQREEARPAAGKLAAVARIRASGVRF